MKDLAYQSRRGSNLGLFLIGLGLGSVLAIGSSANYIIPRAQKILESITTKRIVCEYSLRRPSPGDSIRRFINTNRGNTSKEIPTSSLIERLIIDYPEISQVGVLAGREYNIRTNCRYSR
ncbi:hypothetical protein HYX17_03150 [Candidatus Woesearchaeota archaeon]|nr:hypothetical protein [Candidatus Woesearchaeota archaeon]